MFFFLDSDQNLTPSSSSGPLSRQPSDFIEELPYYHRPKKPRIELVSKDVAMALDRTKTSSRGATHILAAVTTNLGHDLDTVNLSHRTVHRARIRIRKKIAKQLKANLHVAKHLILHWDGKTLPDLVRGSKFERLPIVVSGLASEQLLGVPKAIDGRVANHATCILDTLAEWGLEDRIRGLCFDTTPTNTGKIFAI